MINTLTAIQHLLSMIYSQKIATGDCYISGVDYCCNHNHKSPLWVNGKTSKVAVGDVLACDICDDNSHTDLIVSFFFRETSNVSHDSAQKKHL